MTLDSLIERARTLLTESGDSESVSREKLHALVPVAISALHEAILKDRAKLDGFKQDVSVAAVNGVADLTNVVRSTGLRLDLLCESDVRVSYAGNPSLKTVQFVSSLDRFSLGGIQDFLFILAFVSGNKIYLRDNATPAPPDPTNTVTQTLNLRAVCLPDSVDKVPDYMEGELIQILANLSKTEIADTSATVPSA